MTRGWKNTGFTLTELLAVLAIIGLLATIAIPTYVQRIHLSRVKTAQMETREIAEAQEQVLAIHGFYLPIQMLDDVSELQGATPAINADTIIEDRARNHNLIDPHFDVIQQQGNQLQLQDDATNIRVRNLIQQWQGPFLRTKRVFIGNSPSDDPVDLIGVLPIDDHPLDPWGNPYRFYSALGLIGSSAQNTDPSNWNTANFSDGLLTTTDDRFDRFAIVSFGPDGDSDGNTNNDDDIIYFFGNIATESNFNPVF